MSRKTAFPGLAAKGPVRHLAVVFGDQLNHAAALLRDLDDKHDAILMMEVANESTAVPSHAQRTTLFLSAMRHFAVDQHDRGRRMHYVRLDQVGNTQSFEGELDRALRRLKPDRLRCTEPGEWRVLHSVERAATDHGVPLDILPDDHFLVSHEQFATWMAGRKRPIMEYFYREQRRALNVLMEPNGQPVGGQWNFDKDNRQSFKQAPDSPRPYTPRVDDITSEVIDLLCRRLPDLPGHLEHFRWPVTRRQALRALADFIEHRLAYFGDYQDAMWTGASFLYHSILSAALNLKLLDPRECVQAAIDAFHRGAAPLNSVEGFVRQLIGWREFIRGIYWHQNPEYGQRNALKHHGQLPDFYWTGETDMACMRACIGQVLDTGYGHHIQRLMVTGNFALTAGVSPQAVSDWYLGMYVDGVDWVTLPNTLGMAMHADGGVVGTKPYASSGKYIQRMSNYCTSCPYDPGTRAGPRACPFTTFYWDFLLRHQGRFERNNRMAMILKNLARMAPAEKKHIRQHAEDLRLALGITSVEPE